MNLSRIARWADSSNAREAIGRDYGDAHAAACDSRGRVTQYASDSLREAALTRPAARIDLPSVPQ